MKRDPAALANERFDLLVVGAGIHGACVARDAAMRGMRVALMDRGDFGCATSHNSLKIVHGGLRYLQHADFRRVRESVRERRFWLTAAPHLVRPLRFVIPLYGRTMRGPMAMRAAFLLYGLLARDRNKGVRKERHIDIGHVLSKSECREYLPHTDPRGLTGGAVFYDGQMLDADRILLECVRSAQQAGAVVVNYIEASDFNATQGTITGVRARDTLTQESFDIRARLTINAAGPWALALLQKHGIEGLRHDGLVKGMNVVVPKIFDGYAAGLGGRGSQRLFFVTPWENVSVIGTSHETFSGTPDSDTTKPEEVQAFLDACNQTYPLNLTLEDVRYTYRGLTPGEQGVRSRRSTIQDHGRGLITVSGVKYTTARLVAEDAVDLAAKRLGGATDKCSTAQTQLPGAKHFTGDDVSALVRDYGDAAKEVEQLGHGDELAGRCRYAVRHEMAVRLSDVVRRRVNSTHRDGMTQDALKNCASIMADELGWDAARRAKEIEQAGVPLTLKPA